MSMKQEVQVYRRALRTIAQAYVCETDGCRCVGTKADPALCVGGEARVALEEGKEAAHK